MSRSGDRSYKYAVNVAIWKVNPTVSTQIPMKTNQIMFYIYGTAVLRPTRPAS